MVRTLRVMMVVAVAAAGALQGAEPAGGGGRFLFAGDDDWDWATPLGAEEPCKLVRYGAMPWSALDWAEDGLEEVRGALIGVAPDPKKTMTMNDLSALRGEKCAYTHHAQAPGVIARLLEGEKPPNVIILMQNTSKAAALDDGSVAELARFVKAGGRVVVLDEWNKYAPVLEAMVAEALALPPGPAIPDAPAPEVGERPAAAQEEKPAPEEEPDPAHAELGERFRELLPKLSDDDFKVREEASAAIHRLGVDVLEFFDEVETDDPEVAARLGRIRERLKPPRRAAPLSDAQQRAARHARIAASAKVATDAAAKLERGNTSHRLSQASVDGDKQPMPVLRIAFPADR